LSDGGPQQVERRATGPDRTTLAAFVTFVVLAGGNVIAVRSVSCQGCELDPFWAAASRFLLAALTLASIAIVLRAGFPGGRALVGAVLYGVLGFGAAFAFAYWGLQRVSGGLGAILLATVPLLTFVFALAHRQERFRWGGLAGGILAIAGMAVIFREGVGAGVPITSLLALLAGAACFAETGIVVKAFPPVHPAAMNAIGLGVGGGMLLALTAIYGEAHVVPELTRTWLAQAYLVILGSVVVFTLYVFVLRRWTASAVSYEGVLIPLVAIVLAWWLQDERITWAFAAGSVLVLIGVYVGALRRPSEEREPEAVRVPSKR
jgi:drug/metabolite transporter (DMT)-like permease